MVGKLPWLLGCILLSSTCHLASGKKRRTPPKFGPEDWPVEYKLLFKPGQLGVGADWNRGIVNRVDEGGQGAAKGVKVGDIIKFIDGKMYHERLLDKRIAGAEDYEITFARPPAHMMTTAEAPAKKPAEKDYDDAPPRPDFKFATELVPETFKSMVEGVINGTAATSGSPPAYYPIVMFHMSWCKHCKYALPEYEKAAASIDQRKTDDAKKGEDKGRIYPKLFLVECDKPAEHKSLCDAHTDKTFPVIKVFRDQRTKRFDRPRSADVFKWWSMYVSRPPLLELGDDDGFIKTAPLNPVFILNVDHSTEQGLKVFEQWREMVLDVIDDAGFTACTAKPHSKVGKLLPPAPSISVFGKGLEPLAYQGEFTAADMIKFVNFNKFKPVASLSGQTDSDLRRSGYTVIALMYNGQDEVLKNFELQAQRLRQDRRYLFAAVDVSFNEGREYVEYAFPLLSPNTTSSPLVFAFADNDVYWENPEMVYPTELRIDSIEAFLANSENRQDKSTEAWIREKKKVAIRFATGSAFGTAAAALLVIFSIALVIFCLIPVFKALLISDDDVKKD